MVHIFTISVSQTSQMSGSYSNKSPLRYPGGKTRACSKLDDIFIKNFKVDEIKRVVSPFFGGGSFEFYLQNKYKYQLHVNDKFTPLWCFWNTCQNNRGKLVKRLNQYIGKVDKDLFMSFRGEIMDENGSDLDRAIMYFIINRCSFSGATLSGGFSNESSKKRFTKSSIERIENLNLDDFKMKNKDFTKYLRKTDKFNEKKTFIFLDPPYYLGDKSKLYGSNGDMHENFDHKKLFRIISKRKNWMMTYNDCDFIRNLYKNCKIIETEWSYGMNKSKESSEIVIIG